MSVAAQKEKDKGNAAFKAGDFPAAIGHYTAAFISDPSNATYPLNRAAAYLKLGKNEDAERDCEAVIRLDKENVKGFFRRGQARVALQKLREAEADFQEASRLEPANDAVKQELKKAQDALKAVPRAQKPRKPIDIASRVVQPSSTAGTPPPRRRIPITIVEADPGPAASTSTSTAVSAREDGGASLITPVSSRALSRSTSSSGTASSKAPTDTPQTSSTSGSLPAASEASAGPKVPPQTFREAKAAREELRPRGGIFRPGGKTSLFYASGSSNGEISTPKRETPQTLVAFMRLWDTLTTEDERWDVLRQIPVSRLPTLFKTSLDATVLAAIVRSLRAALAAALKDGERVSAVRAYMVNLPRVPRFSTVSMMMSAEERADVQAVWDLLGHSSGEGIEGEMDKRKDDGSKRAWGCR